MELAGRVELEIEVFKASLDDAVNVTVNKEIQLAFDFLNHYLFDGALTRPLITFDFSRQYKATFTPDMYVTKSGAPIHSIMLNLFLLEEYKEYEILQNLTHEMVHQKQYESGEMPANRGYHNKAFCKKMVEIGLKPISSDGKDTGFNVADEVIEGGLFDRVAKELIVNHNYSLGIMSPSLIDMSVCPDGDLDNLDLEGGEYLTDSSGEDEDNVIHGNFGQGERFEQAHSKVDKPPLEPVLNELIVNVVDLVTIAHASGKLATVSIGDGYALENRGQLNDLADLVLQLIDSTGAHKFRVCAAFKKGSTVAKQMLGNSEGADDPLAWCLRKSAFSALSMAAESIAGLDRLSKAASTVSSRIKYECSQCQAKIWGKASLNVVCGKCQCAFVPKLE